MNVLDPADVQAPERTTRTVRVTTTPAALIRMALEERADTRATSSDPGSVAEPGKFVADYLDRNGYQIEAKPSTDTVVICGSMTLAAHMREEAARESLAGAIVLLPHVDMRDPGHLAMVEAAGEAKAGLDRLHLDKIRAADRVTVLVRDGRVGESTAAEIDFATQLGKTITYRGVPSRPDVGDEILADPRRDPTAVLEQIGRQLDALACRVDAREGQWAAYLSAFVRGWLHRRRSR